MCNVRRKCLREVLEGAFLGPTSVEIPEMNAATPTTDNAAGDGADASGRPAFVFPKARYILDTESTLAQMAAEAEW